MENILPQWAPNLHPLLVHFPIAILLTASLADFVLVLWTNHWLRMAVLALFVVGTLTLAATYWSGTQAIDSVQPPMQAELTASHHANWAYYTLLFYAAYISLRTALAFSSFGRKRWVTLFFFLVGLAGMALIATTADLGGQLVYQYGVGVEK